MQGGQHLAALRILAIGIVLGPGVASTSRQPVTAICLPTAASD